MSGNIYRFAIIFGLLAFHISVLRFVIEKFLGRDFDFFGGESNETPSGHIYEYFEELLRYINIAIAIIVVGITEGLSITVMASLALSMRAMSKEKIYVKRIVTFEKMRRVNEICCDKTGTLTLNKMAVTNIFTNKDCTILPYID